jgi:lysophospholipase L1-like esterase
MRRFKTFGLALVAVLATGAVAAESASAEASSAAPIAAGSGYLALGDSVPFGYIDSGAVPAPDYHLASGFVGYPELVAEALGLDAENASCPGETTASFINPSAQSLGCENEEPGTPAAGAYRVRYPLHASYTGSQLGYALTYLSTHQNVSLVSLMIGANDFFLCVIATRDGCERPAELRAVVAKVKRNVSSILSAIRTTAHYEGTLVIVNYYSLNYASKEENEFSNTVNRTVDTAASPFHVVIADGYGVLKAASERAHGNTCAAGLLVRLRHGKCGIHPSRKGQMLLAKSVEEAVGH